MKSFIEKAMKIHRNQKGFTLIELLVVLAILAIIVGLIVPNFFGLTDESYGIQIQGQHEKMREAVFLYYEDTSVWPMEWSADPITTVPSHQLWFADGKAGWDGPYVDRPILQENWWGGNWGVQPAQQLNLIAIDNTAGELYTVLKYTNVPDAVALQVDTMMDDGDGSTHAGRTTGAVQYGGTDPVNSITGGGPPDNANVMVIIIAPE